MSNSVIEILLSSDSDYEKLTAEIYCDNKFVALLNQDYGQDNIIIEFPGNEVHRESVMRKINLAVFEKALVLAKNKIKKD